MLKALQDSWWIALKDIKIMVQDIPGLIWHILVPIAGIVAIAYPLHGIWDSTPRSINLPVVLQSEGPNTMILLNSLARDKTIHPQFYYKELGREKLLTVNKARELVCDTKAALVIHRGFEEGITSGDKNAVTIICDPNDHVISDQVHSTLSRLVSKINTQKVPPALGALGHGPSPFEYCIPGWAVTFMLLSAAFSAVRFIDEKEQGLLQRLQGAPISSHSLLMGTFLSGLAQSNILIALLLAVAALASGMRLGTSIAGLAALTIATTVATAGIGVLLAVFCSTKRQVRTAGVLLVLMNCALGGCWWPQYLAPGNLQKLGWLTINSWVVDGYNEIIIYGKGFSSITTDISMLALMGAVFLIVGFGKFNSEEYVDWN